MKDCQMEELEHQHPHLAALESAISSKTLQCPSGTISVDPEDPILWYSADNGTQTRYTLAYYLSDADNLLNC